MSVHSSMTSGQFGFFRVFFGAAVTTALVEWGAEATSVLGRKSIAGVDPFWRLPEVFGVSVEPVVAVSLMGLASIAASLITIGYYRRIAAGVVLLLGAALGDYFLGVLGFGVVLIAPVLLALTLIPPGERFTIQPPVSTWTFPPAISRLVFGFWVSWAAASGWIHAGLPGLESIPGALVLLGELPVDMPRGYGWACAAFLALPFAFSSRTQRWSWWILLSLQVILGVDPFYGSGGFLALIATLFVMHREWVPPILEPSEDPPVIFFDGVCGLCNRAVDFILAEDDGAHFRFAPTQSERAKSLGSEEVSSGKSMALVVGDTVYTRSDAVWRIAQGLGGWWRILSVFRWVPRPLRDAVYELLQRNRYALFGKRASCRLPAPSERARFVS